MKTNVERVNEAYDEYNDNFERSPITGSFHNALWQLLINEVHKGHVFCFWVVVGSEGNQLVVAFGTGGYQETGIYFKSSNFNECCSVVEGINQSAFNLDVDDTNYIVANSMGMSA
jgi:hypothetical protein